MHTLIEHHETFLRQLMRHEGTRKDKRGRHVAYRCQAGALTIGYGHNLDANPIPGVGEGDVLYEDEARELLIADVERFGKDLDKKLPWWRELNEPRQAVLLNMAFNMGVPGLMKFRRTLQAVREQRWDDARTGMMASVWARQVKKRRSSELATQMLTGRWQYPKK